MHAPSRLPPDYWDRHATFPEKKLPGFLLSLTSPARRTVLDARPDAAMHWPGLGVKTTKGARDLDQACSGWVPSPEPENPRVPTPLTQGAEGPRTRPRRTLGCQLAGHWPARSGAAPGFRSPQAGTLPGWWRLSTKKGPTGSKHRGRFFTHRRFGALQRHYWWRYVSGTGRPYHYI